MRTNFLKQFTAWTLTLCYLGQITAGVVAAKTPVAKWNKISSKWASGHTEAHVTQDLKTLSVTFNPKFEKDDRLFLTTTLAQQEEFPKMTPTDKGVLLESKLHPEAKLEVVSLGGNDFTLNGKKFTYNNNLSLQANQTAIAKVLFAKTAKASYFDSLLFPSAEAGVFDWIGENPGWSALIGGALIYLTINVVKNWGTIKEGAHEVSDGTGKIIGGATGHKDHNDKDGGEN